MIPPYLQAFEKLSPAPDRGRLLDAREIAREIFRETVSPDWVKRNVAPDRKLRLGHSTVRWWENDVLTWINQRGTAA